MQRQSVTSSNVKSVGYEPALSLLEVEFNNNTVYQYVGVPVEKHQAMMKAESVGKFLNSEIKPHYPALKIEPTPTPVVLPEKASALIRLALSDLAKVEASDKYLVEMGTWHEPVGEGTCLVCLAGSVMAMTLNIPFEANVHPADAPNINSYTRCRLFALDDFRRGYILDGLNEMFVSSNDRVTPIDPVPYFRDPKQFRQDMNDMADMLERAGL